MERLQEIARQLDELRAERDKLLITTPGSLRTLAQAAGVSHETVREIQRRQLIERKGAEK